MVIRKTGVEGGTERLTLAIQFTRPGRVLMKDEEKVGWIVKVGIVEDPQRSCLSPPASG